jgi:hypothetical protein
MLRLTDVDPNHKGSNIYIKKAGSYYPILRLEISGSNAFKLDEAQKYIALKKPYIPDSEKSVYIKTPTGSLYETNFTAKKFSNINSKITINNLGGEKIFQPYLSWHGGIGGKDLKPSVGEISLRGLNFKGQKTRSPFNSSVAIAKDSFAANYNPIATVTFPRTLNAYPKPVKITKLYKPVTCIKYDDKKFNQSRIQTERNDIVIDYYEIAHTGLTAIICVHNPAPVHKSRFTTSERLRWLFEPITYELFHDVPLACSVFFSSTNVDVVISDAPLIFVGYSVYGHDNIAFLAFKV